jgi:hypothetical protein
MVFEQQVALDETSSNSCVQQKSILGSKESYPTTIPLPAPVIKTTVSDIATIGNACRFDQLQGCSGRLWMRFEDDYASRYRFNFDLKQDISRIFRFQSRSAKPSMQVLNNWIYVRKRKFSTKISNRLAQSETSTATFTCSRIARSMLSRKGCPQFGTASHALRRSMPGA